MRKLTFFLALVLLLTACAPGQPGSGSSSPDASKSDLTSGGDSQWQTVTILGEEMQWNGYTVKEPESNLEIASMTFADFGDNFFTREYPVSVDTYVLTPGAITEAEVYHIKAKEEGPTVYVVAGVHGDERAAWYAGMLLRSVTLAKGELYVVAPANTNGAKLGRRYVTGNQDLNRSFPGDPNGNEAQKMANAIFEDIRDKQPDFVFDLHEAIVYKEGRDFLGSTLIFTKLDGMEDLFFDLLFATDEGLTTTPFGYTGPGPAGSLNSTVSNELNIPIVTVETFRGFRMERRVSDQLTIVQYTLEYLGLR